MTCHTFSFHAFTAVQMKATPSIKKTFPFIASFSNSCHTAYDSSIQATASYKLTAAFRASLRIATGMMETARNYIAIVTPDIAFFARRCKNKRFVVFTLYRDKY
jgi:hypothetical protein